MIQKKLSQFFKKNLSAILFFSLIFFGVASFSIKNSQETNYAKEVIDYAENSVPTLRTKFAEIVELSQNRANDDTTYSEVFAKLDEFQKTTLDLAAKVPSKSGDSDTRMLEQGLKDFILTINDETVKTLQNEYKLRQEIRVDQNLYSEIKATASNNNTTKLDLEKNYNAGLKVLEFNRKIEKDITFLQEQASAKSNNDALEASLNKVKTVLDNSANTLSGNDKNALTQIYSDGWPVKPLVFSSINQTDLENDKFVDNIKQLQQLVTTLRQKFSL
jgi:hypothetical protein